MILLACPRCDRQYDVSHLAPKTKVRCACGERIEVTWREPFVVAHLQCRNCGGPVEPEDEACRYCGAALPERDRELRSLCPKCFARIEADSRVCRMCGVEIRPQALRKLPARDTCPRCESELHVRVVDRDEVVECGGCEGLWIEAGTFERLVRVARTEPPPPRPPESPSSTPSEPPAYLRYIPCLACGELMFRRQFKHAGRPSGVVVDACRDHGVWLDRSELERVLAHVREASAGAVERLGGDLGGVDHAVRTELRARALRDAAGPPPTPLGRALLWMSDLLETMFPRP